MGNEAPEASGRSEVMPAAAREEGRACVCVCARGRNGFVQTRSRRGATWFHCLGCGAAGLFSHLRVFIFSSDTRKHFGSLTGILSNPSALLGLCGCLHEGTGRDTHISAACIADIHPTASVVPWWMFVRV